jgi:hypothetical protein
MFKRAGAGNRGLLGLNQNYRASFGRAQLVKFAGIRYIIAAALACGIAITSTALFAQQPMPTAPIAADSVTLADPDPGFELSASPWSGGKQIIGQSFDGISFLGSRIFIPPDTNAAVGNDFLVETVNVQIRVFDKASGALLLDEPLATFFGAFSGGDPYVVYDDTADRWYVSAFDTNDTGLFLAVSLDGNPLHGFLPTYHLTDVGGFPDYEKPGFNKDAIFISFNNFGDGGGAATIATIDKQAALLGTLTYVVSHPEFQFRAMAPAQMHLAQDGGGHRHAPAGVEWFVSTDSNDVSGTTIRVTQMTNYLSNSPNFTYTSLPVSAYRSATTADQPGGTITTFPNTTTTQVQFHNGELVAAMASATATDGFVYPKGRIYRIDVSRGTPTLLAERLIDPGNGVAVQMPSVDEDSQGNLGLTWMESSKSEYLTMWVATLDRFGKLTAAVAAPGGGFFYANSRIGDYSTTVLDLTNDQEAVFWSANRDAAYSPGSRRCGDASIPGMILIPPQCCTCCSTEASNPADAGDAVYKFVKFPRDETHSVSVGRRIV